MPRRFTDEAFEMALKLYEDNHRSTLSARDKDDLKKAVVRLVQDGMTDKDLVASFAINRARLAR